MMNVQDKIVGYSTKNPSLYMEDRTITKESDRLVECRERLIKSVYELLKSEEFADFYLKRNEHLKINLNIGYDHITVNY